MASLGRTVWLLSLCLCGESSRLYAAELFDDCDDWRWIEWCAQNLSRNVEWYFLVLYFKMPNMEMLVVVVVSGSWSIKLWKIDVNEWKMSHIAAFEAWYYCLRKMGKFHLHFLDRLIWKLCKCHRMMRNTGKMRKNVEEMENSRNFTYIFKFSLEKHRPKHVPIAFIMKNPLVKYPFLLTDSYHYVFSRMQKKHLG